MQLYLQPTQDLTVDAESGPTEYRVSVEGANTQEVNDWAVKLAAALASEKQARQRHHRRGRQGPVGLCRTSTATPPRAWASRPASVDDALYSAFGQRIISNIFTETNQYRVILEARPGDATPAGPRRACSCNPPAARPRSRRWPRIQRDRPRRCRCATWPSSRPPPSASTPAPGASLGAAVSRDPQGRRQDRQAGGDDPDLPGRGGRLRELAEQRAVADPGRGGLRLHRAGRALRELHPPADDPLDPALGRASARCWP